jgi:thiol:disulfide interchange protein
MTRSEAQNSSWARILVFLGLALWLVSLFLNEEWMVAVAAVFTVVGAVVYWTRLRASGHSPS